MAYKISFADEFYLPNIFKYKGNTVFIIKSSTLSSNISIVLVEISIDSIRKLLDIWIKINSYFRRHH